MGWVKGSDRNFEASQTERYRKTKKDRRVGVCTKERKGITAAKPQIELGHVFLFLLVVFFSEMAGPEMLPLESG